MSQIVFYSTIDMQNVLGTPSNGYSIAYDLDGVLKQKDSTGLITPIGYIEQYNLQDILGVDNQTGTYSLILGEGSLLKSDIGNSIINLSNGNTYSVLLNVSDFNTGTSSILMEPNIFQIKKQNSNYDSNFVFSGNTFSTQLGTPTQSTNIIQDDRTFKIQLNQSTIGVEYSTPLMISNNSDGLSGLVKSSVHINSNNSSTNFGVYNSVIIGGQNLAATQSNTVYLGNNVNINNEYQLPNVDGVINQVLKTDGVGNVYWGNFDPPATFSLSEVLSAGSNTGTYSITLGSSQSINTQNGTSIYLDHMGVTNSVYITGDDTKDYSMNIMNDNLYLNFVSGLITTGDGLGLRYLGDYDENFTSTSLVTKSYVDSVSTTNYHYSYKTVYVDSLYGDNSTAQIGRIDLPYSTFASASQALSTLSSIPGNNKMFIRKGDYSEIIILSDNTDYYCEFGSVFNGQGFTDDSLNVNCNIFGYAKFTGLNPALEIKNASNVNFEFDSIDNLDVALKLSGSGKINVRGRNIKSKSDFGSAISLQGSSTININIADGIYGAYDTIYVKDNFSGDLVVKCKEIVCDNSISTQGNLPNQGHALRVNDLVTGKVLIYSNLYNKNTTSSTGDNSAAKISSGTVTINGNIYGGDEIGLYVTDGNITINGNIKTNSTLCINSVGSPSLKVNDSFISNNSNYTISIKGGDSNNYFINSTIYNGGDDSNIFYLEGNLPSLSIYNCISYSSGDLGYFIFATPSTSDVGIHNTRSNKDNYNINDIFSPSGFIYDSDFHIPNF